MTKDKFCGIIKSIDVIKFRKMHDVSFELGEYVTAIAGQNSTMKTTLLGMLGQPFSFSKNEENNPFFSEKTLMGTTFEGKLSDKFKLDTQKHDLPGTHHWRLNFYENFCPEYNDYIEMLSEERKEKKTSQKLRFWTTRGRGKGDGYEKLPIIFMSLKRLLPIGEVQNLKVTPAELSEEEKSWYQERHNSILALNDETILSTSQLAGSSKQTIGPETANYGPTTISSGQDNVGQILLAILSFKRLKEKYPEDYRGGLLLIDEMDSTLYPFAQKKLLELFFKFARDYHIQIVFTTHSDILIKEMLSGHYKDNGKLLFLKNSPNGVVELEKEYLTLDRIDAHLSLSPINEQTQKQPKIRIYTEDNEARAFAKFLIGRNFKFSYVDVAIGCDQLTALCTKTKVPEFTDNLIILDGDNSGKPAVKKNKNIICLPDGNDKLSPDQLFYSFLKNLPEDDKF